MIPRSGRALLAPALTLLMAWLSPVQAQQIAQPKANTQTARSVSSNFKADPALARTQFATPQISAPVPQSFPAPPPPPSVPVSAPVMMATTQATTMVQVPAPLPYGISVPSAPIVVTPGAPSIYVAQAPPPNVYLTTAAQSAPNVYISQAVQPHQQLFVAAPLALPPSAPANVTMLASSFAAAPQALATQAPPQAIIVHSPGLFGHLIGTIGEHLVKYKWPRVQLGTAPMATTQTLPMMTYAAAPQSIPMSPQQVVVNPPSQPTPPMATPQSTYVPEARHGWFHKR